jgi:hypothetical protein
MIKIEINTENAAFDETPNIELARILREIADKVEAIEIPKNVRDINGNVCGTIKWSKQ